MLKISIASIGAIVLAELLALNYTVSAGIVAILSVAPTKKETIKTATNRFYAFIVAVTVAYICYHTIGFNLYAFFVYLIVYIMLCMYMGWNSAMAVNSVLISHFLSEQNMYIGSVMNETFIFVIGAMLGIMVNLHLHKDTHYVQTMMDETDKLIKIVLHQISQRILTKNKDDYDTKHFKKIEESLHIAKNKAEENFMNQFGNSDLSDIEYIAMRKKQVHILYSIHKKANGVVMPQITAQSIAELLDKISSTFNKSNTVEDLLSDFYELSNQLKQFPLPVERSEFEDRAELYIMMSDIEEFLLLKNKFMEEQS